MTCMMQIFDYRENNAFSYEEALVKKLVTHIVT